MAIEDKSTLEIRGRTVSVVGQKTGATSYKFTADCGGFTGEASLYSGAHPEKGITPEYFQQCVNRARIMAAERAVLHAEHAEMEARVV